MQTLLCLHTNVPQSLAEHTIFLIGVSMKQAFTILSGILAAVLLLWLLRYTLPLFAPFLPALAAAAIIEPAVQGMCRRGVRRNIASALVTTVALGLCFGVVLLCAVGSSGLVSAYAGKVPDLLVVITDTTQQLRHALDTVMASMPRETAAQLSVMVDGFAEQLSALPTRLSRQALEGMTAVAKASPDGLLFLCTAVIGVYFFSLYYRDMGAFFRRQLSEPMARRLHMVGTVLREALGGYLKVQCILSGVTFLILLAAFAMMDIPDSLPAAAGIAVIDALPILGAGAVLLPWALIALLLGRPSRAIALLAIYGVLLVVHNVLQAKLMGSRLGLHPAAALVSLYAGWQLAGLWGMIGLPMVCVVLSSLNSSGVIKLYR